MTQTVKRRVKRWIFAWVIFSYLVSLFGLIRILLAFYPHPVFALGNQYLFSLIALTLNLPLFTGIVHSHLPSFFSPKNHQIPLAMLLLTGIFVPLSLSFLLTSWPFHTVASTLLLRSFTEIDCVYKLGGKTGGGYVCQDNAGYPTNDSLISRLLYSQTVSAKIGLIFDRSGSMLSTEMYFQKNYSSLERLKSSLKSAVGHPVVVTFTFIHRQLFSLSLPSGCYLYFDPDPLFKNPKIPYCSYALESK